MTTTALNLLAAIAQRKRRPLGIDLDLRATRRLFGVQPRLADDTVGGFFMRQRALDDIAQIWRSGVVLCLSHLELAKLDSLLGKGGTVTRPGGAACKGRASWAGDHRLLSAAQRAFAQCGIRRRYRAGAQVRGLSHCRARNRWSALRMPEPVFKRRLPRRYVLTRLTAAKG